MTTPVASAIIPTQGLLSGLVFDVRKVPQSVGVADRAAVYKAIKDKGCPRCQDALLKFRQLMQFCIPRYGDATIIPDPVICARCQTLVFGGSRRLARSSRGWARHVRQMKGQQP